MREKKVLLFDLDGTLVDSVPDLADSLNEMLLSLGYPTYSQEEIRSWVGNGATVLVRRGLGGGEIDMTIEQGVLKEALELFLKFYKKNLCVKSKLYPNVKETLLLLKQKGFLLALVTNKPEEFISPLLKELGIYNLFKIYVGADTLERKKPDPMPLLYVSEQLDYSIQKCVMIGDSKNDILAAKACEMDSIGVNYGYNYDEHIQSYAPTHVIENFDQLITLLGVDS